ncbi:MAG TPA: IclR family transcriptional regulator [Eubacteriaceae bacterium]|nr:IclR family transcriptional regulator [Eubacteriaceae bacterium]
MTEKGIVQSIDRALSILEVLSDYSEGLGVTEISEQVNLHKSTVYRLLTTLIYKGYVVQDTETNKYGITLKLFELGSKKVESMDLLSVSKEYTKKLMESVNEVVHLVVREGSEIVYIDKVEANNTIMMASTIGKRSPMYCTSVGKAILAHLPEKKVKEIWDNSKIVKYTDYTITDFEELKTELEDIRQKGYAVDNEENEIGVRCIGVPIFNRHGKVEAAISISGPAIRVTESKISNFSIKVMNTASLISRELGFIR